MTTAVAKPEILQREQELLIRGELSLQEWQRLGERLGRTRRAHQWWIGDWLNYGEARYGMKYASAPQVTGLGLGTLQNCAMVAAAFEPSRRREVLSWSHHYELTGLPPAKQDEWLDRAEAQNITREQLRAAVRPPAPRPLLDPEPEVIPDAVEIVTCPHCGEEFEL